MNEASDVPGRHCPIDYCYAASDLAQQPVTKADTLYVVGGLYGNLQALAAVEACARAESATVTIVFNGDFNWFNVDAAAFAEINNRVLARAATRGNVETELARDTDLGCGCAYPDWVDQSAVDQSNTIMRRLKRTARSFPGLVQSLAALPMYRVYEVAGRRIAVLHGDAESLAGWRFSRDSLSQPRGRERARHWFDAAGVDVFASSHTCTPVLARLAQPDRIGVVANNGAAGMPNFRSPCSGIVTRLGPQPAIHSDSVLGMRLGDLFIDALAVDYDKQAWLAEFLANWPPGSAAHESYYGRLLHGPEDAVADALIL